MNDSIRQLAVLAQGSGREEWVNILFIAVMAVLWLVGGLIKAAGQKRPNQPKQPEGLAKPQRRLRESWQERLTRKAEELQRAVEARSRQAMEQTRVRGRADQNIRTRQPPAGRITVRPGERGQSVMVYEPPAPQQPATERAQQATRQQKVREAVAAAGRQATAPAPEIAPRVTAARSSFEPIAEGLTDVMRELPRPLEPGVQPLEPARESAGLRAASIIDYQDPDALRKAILHYEILGRPLALRDPPEQIPL